MHKGRVVLVLFGLALSRLCLQRDGGVESSAGGWLTLRAPEGGPASRPCDEVNDTRGRSQQQATARDNASGQAGVLWGENVAADIVIDDLQIIWR